MGLLEGKNALVFGLANDRSIAWGIIKTLHEQSYFIVDGEVKRPLDKLHPLFTQPV